ncbi:MAG TPA: DNA-processing protein DprA, partial [Ramlibacter sp.]|nr:DNA-processing protein DprA [Ramlibacter sp.]
MERDELAAWLRLALAPGVGPATARRLLAAFGLPQRIFEQEPEALRSVASGAQVHALGQEPPGFAAQLDITASWLQESGSRRILTLADPLYPPALLHTEDPPLLLYLSGMALQAWPRTVAVVGSRNPTPQGA